MKVIALVWMLGWLSAAAVASSSPTQIRVGVQTFKVYSQARQQALAVTVWYPAVKGGKQETIGENMIFQGSMAWQGADLVDGQFPLILLSHGSGSSVLGMAWVATALAQQGYIVAGPNHPRTMSGDSTPEDTPKLWQRTNDLSTLIDFFSVDKTWKEHVNAERIGVLGFSLGGAAAMGIIGATVKLDDYISYCDTYPDMSDCQWFAGEVAYIDKQKVDVKPFDLRTLSRVLYEQSNYDARVKAAVVVDPSMAKAFVKESVKRISIPITFINLGEPEAIVPAVDVKGLVDQSEQGTLLYVDKSTHYSFLPECKMSAALFLTLFDETDPVCEDGGQREREDIHQELTEKITQAFAKTF